MKKDFLGQPVWVWLIGAAVVVGGYLYIRHSSGQASGSGTTPGQGGGGKYTSTSSFRERLTEHQGGGGTGGDGSGPERMWLIHKTGSQHPWTWLAQHHETIAVGPHGSRRIVKKK